jgi:hypothetical protein
VRQPVLDAYSQAVGCGAPVGQVQGVGQVGRAVVLPSDIALSALTGTGGFVVELGGGTATTEGNTFANPFDTSGAPSPLGTLPIDTATPTGDVLGSSISDGLTGTVGDTAPSVADLTPGGAPTLAAVGASTVPGSRGGTAVVMGLLGLLAVGGVALADYLRIRRGGRVIPT